MASVYRGIQDAEPRHVAIKIMHPHLVEDPTFVRRFQREAKAAAQIQHPNTVQIIDFGVDEGLPYIVMELLGGQDLFETLVIERQLSERRAARILIQICDALSAAHDKGIVHRDLKPENVMLLSDPAGGEEAERIKVLDFGIAKVLERDPGPDKEPNSMANSALTTVGMVVGTPAYMSPEQCRGEPIDARSDVYACGILLYQLVTGRLPFAGDNAVDLALKHVRMPPPPPHTWIPGLNADLEAVILMALNKWPAQRQQSAREFASELARLLPRLSGAPLAPPLLSSGASEPAATLPLPLLATPRRSVQETLDADALSTLRSEPDSSPPPGPATVKVEVVAPPPIPAALLQKPEDAAALPNRTLPLHDAAGSLAMRELPAAPRRPLPTAPPRREATMWPILLVSVMIGVLVGVGAFLLVAR